MANGKAFKPEGKKKDMIDVNQALCLRCGGCVGTCPKSALNLTEHGIVCDKRCVSCGTCVGFCPVGALKVRK